MNELQTTKSKRVLEIEIMKAVAIIAMVFVHVYEMCVNQGIHTSGGRTTSYLIEFLGGIPSAGVFMFAMGFGAGFSKRATAKTYIKRFYVLFILGIAVNVFEEIIPAILVPSQFGTVGRVLPALLATDIYFFAALMSLYFALMKKLEGKKYWAVSISAVLVALCVCTNAIVGFETFTTGNVWTDTVLGLFIRVNHMSFFPFVAWCVFPIVGYGISFCFKKMDVKKAVKIAIPLGIGLIVLSKAIMYISGMMDVTIVDAINVEEGFYYGLHPIHAMCGFGIIFLEFAAAYFILKLTKQHIPNVVMNMSKNVMHIYIIQWLVIGLLSPVLVSVTSIWVCVLCGVMILVGAYYGGALLKKSNLIRV